TFALSMIPTGTSAFSACKRRTTERLGSGEPRTPSSLLVGCRSEQALDQAVTSFARRAALVCAISRLHHRLVNVAFCHRSNSDRRLDAYPKSAIFSPTSRALCEARFAIVTNVGCGMRWTLWCRKTNDAV